nr:Ppx/GppA phosphatase family protein [uncultured Cohaesibacter sp.]
MATGLADGDQPKANHEKPAASASESGASSARKSSRRRKRGAKARANGNGDGGNPVAGAARDTRPASGNAHQAPDTSTRSKAAEFPKGSIIDEQNRNRSVRKRREAALNQKAAGQKGQPNSGAQADGRRAQNRAQDAQVAVQRPHADHETETYAALDLGTNNCRLLVAEPYGQSFRVIDAFSRIVRLGEGLSQSGRLSEEAQDRAIAALKVCQSKLNYRAVKRFRLIATEACRRAVNGPAFLNRVHRETGLRLEIVNRETEARLAVAGCASLVHPEADGVVLFDIGGGSSEIVWLDLDKVSDDNALHPGEKRNRQTRRSLRHLSERIRCWTSLQVGVVTLSEKHGGKVVTREHFESMVEDVRGMLGQFEEREALAKAIETKHIHMLGTSGTVTTLAGVHLGLERYDRRQVDGTWLTATELRDMIGRVLDMNFQERMNNPCIGADRADLVLAGCAILEAFHREWPCSQLRVADRGLREGILMEMMIDDGVWNPQTSQPGKKAGPKKKRSRRRGGRGHRGGHGKVKTAESK